MAPGACGTCQALTLPVNAWQMAQTLILRLPWLLPAALCGWNVLYVLYGVLAEQRLKATAAQFVVLYASTIPAAAQGDLYPFFLVAAR